MDAKAFASMPPKGRVPQKLQTDRVKEFFNKHFQNLMSKNKIMHFATGSELKAGITERFNSTLKTRMWRYQTAINSKKEH